MSKNVRRARHSTRRSIITAAVTILAIAIAVKLTVVIYDRFVDNNGSTF